MQLGMIGLGRMGANMVRRLMKAGHACVVYDRTAKAVAELKDEGASGAADMEDFVSLLSKPRAAWIMVPAAVVDPVVEELAGLMDAHACVKEVRGCGYFYAIELMADRDSGRELDDAQVADLQGGTLGRFVRDARILVRPDDRGATMLTISPPLVAGPDVIEDLAGRIDDVLTMTDDHLAAS